MRFGLSILMIGMLSWCGVSDVHGQGADLCANATPTAEGVGIPFDTTGATQSLPVHNCTAGSAAHVWLAYTAGCSGTATADRANRAVAVTSAPTPKVTSVGIAASLSKSMLPADALASSESVTSVSVPNAGSNFKSGIVVVGLATAVGPNRALKEMVAACAEPIECMARPNKVSPRMIKKYV